VPKPTAMGSTGRFSIPSRRSRAGGGHPFGSTKIPESETSRKRGEVLHSRGGEGEFKRWWKSIGGLSLLGCRGVVPISPREFTFSPEH